MRKKGAISEERLLEVDKHFAADGQSAGDAAITAHISKNAEGAGCR